MALPETIALDIPNLLTTAGVVTAVLAALYAGRSARAAQRQADAAEKSVKEAQVQTKLAQAALKEARRQNQIGGHSHRLEVYKVFQAFGSDMMSAGVGFGGEAAIWNLWKYAQTANFYFSDSVTKDLAEFVEEALTNKDMHCEWKEHAYLSVQERQEKVKATFEHFKQLRGQFKSVDAAMRQELKITEDG